MMHHPASQYGSNLMNQQPETDPYPTSQQNQPDPYDSYDSTFSPKGNVAALRNVIHGQLDMKTPAGGGKPSNTSRYQKPAPPPVDPTPSWAKSVKVYEPNGYVDPHLNKHNMGRVLDGPVNPNKFFQGVPPPSYSQVKPETKPPAPPQSKPPIQQTPAHALQAQILQNEYSTKPPSDPYRAATQKAPSYRIPYDVSIDPRHHYGGEFDIDDSASIISSSYTFGDSSEIAAFSAAAEQRHLYEQYRKKLEEEKHDLKEGSETPCVSLVEKLPEKIVEEPTAVPRSIFDTDLTPFGQPVPPVSSSKAEVSPKINTAPLSPQKPDGSPKTFNYSPSSEQKRSIDLESSQLLVKPKSPAPYSTSSTDHYGTIRRKHKPVAIEVSEPANQMFFGSGFEEKPSVNRSPLTPSSASFKGNGFGKSESLINDSLNQAFEIASSIESAKNNYEAPPTPRSVLTMNALSQVFEIASSIETAKNNYQAPPTPKPDPPRSISDTYPVSSAPWSPSMDTSTTSTTTVKEPDGGSMTGSMTMSTSGVVVPTNMDEPIVYGQQQEKSTDSSPDRVEDMSQWYRKMFKQMHKKADDPLVENVDAFVDNNNRTPQSIQIDKTGNLRRSQESLSHQSSRTSASPRAHDSTAGGARFDFEHFEHGIPSTSTSSATTTTIPKRYMPRPPHFHLPTYRFRDEDPRPHRCAFNNCLTTSSSNNYGTPCMMCDRPKRDVEFKEVDGMYKDMQKRTRQRSQNSLDLIRITNNLDETTRSLNLFLQQIDATWKRSKSQPTMRVNNRGMGPSDPLQNYGQAQRLGQKPSTNEDELLRLKAEKLAEELRKEKDRKHGFVPSATPSLQNNMDRLNSLLYDFSNDAPEQNYHSSQPQQQQAVVTATAVYKFEPRSARELPLNRGDIVRIIREVDAYWMEGERNGRCGIFPNSYVQINSGNSADSEKMRAIYPFTARSDTELSLKRGEIITRRRQIDSNWLEGSNQIGIVGIFPASYVEPLQTHEPTAPAPNVFPNRPKTPKIEDQVYNSYGQGAGYTHPVHQKGGTDYGQPQYPQQSYQSQPVATVTPNNKVRFDLPSGSESSLQMPTNPIHIQQSQNPPSYGAGGMKRIEYEREPEKLQKVDDEPILEQYRKTNDEKNAVAAKKENSNILMNAASLIPKGSEMYRAVYPYHPQKDDELQLFTNDIIFVVEKCDDGWFIGTSLRTGEFGIFPGNYVKRH